MPFKLTPEALEAAQEMQSSFRVNIAPSYLECVIVHLPSQTPFHTRRYDLGTSEEKMANETLIEALASGKRPQSSAQVMAQLESGLAEKNAEIAKLRAELEAANKPKPAKGGKKAAEESSKDDSPE